MNYVSLHTEICLAKYCQTLVQIWLLGEVGSKQIWVGHDSMSSLITSLFDPKLLPIQIALNMDHLKEFQWSQNEAGEISK